MTNNTLLTDNEVLALTLDGEALLLCQSDRNGQEDFHRYSANDLVEVFTADEREQLANGEVVLQIGRFGALRWTNLLAAGRATLANG